MTDEIIVQIITEPKSRKGRPRNPDRLTPEGKYNSKPLDPMYFKKYYIEKTKLKQVVCPICHSSISDASNMSKHQKTNKCRSQLESEWKVKLALLALEAVRQNVEETTEEETN